MLRGSDCIDAAELMRSAQQMRLIWERSRDGMRLTDPDGRVVMANEAYCRMVGLPEEALLGRPFTEVYAMRRRERMLESGVQRFRNRAVEPFFVRDVELWDGRVLALSVSNAFVEIDGQSPLLLSIFRDITRAKQTETALRQAKDESENLLASAPVLIAHLDRFGRIRVLSRKAEEVTGYTRAELTGRDWMRLLVPRERFPSAWDAFRHRPGGSGAFSFEAPLRARSGEERTILWKCSDVREGEKIVGIVAFGTDVTEIRGTEAVLQRYQLLLEHSSDIMLLLGADGTIIEANRAAVSAYGYPREQLLQMRMSDLRDRRKESGLPVPLREAPTGAGLVRGSHRRRDGTTFPVEVSSQAATIHSERVLLCVIRDITERKALEAELAHQAFHDPLTGLANRALFLDRLAHALAGTARRNDRVAVLYLDLDRFKVINDSLGHAAGDQLLVALSGRLCSCLRGEDTAARQGGDEFTILLEGIRDECEVVRVAERILNRLQEPFHIQGRDLYVTGSIGIAISRGPNDHPSDLLKDADVAMYQVKEGGRSGYAVFRHEMSPHALERLDMETDLRRAIDRGEFEVHYQPIIRMDTGRVSGLEALVRWQRPHYGLLSPDVFVPLQEQIGLVEPLTLWVLEEARRQWETLRALCPDLTISVNLSARNLHDEAFPWKVAALLDPQSFPQRWLKLEITESATMANPPRAMDILHKLSAMGVRLSIDDFGTGYSSLSYLKQLPIQEIKIDKSFVRDLDPGSENDEAIVHATIDLAHNLRKEVVAEGVESRAAWDTLRALGCDAAQGYYMSPPMPAAELRAWLTTSPYGIAPTSPDPA